MHWYIIQATSNAPPYHRIRHENRTAIMEPHKSSYQFSRPELRRPVKTTGSTLKTTQTHEDSTLSSQIIDCQTWFQQKTLLLLSALETGKSCTGCQLNKAACINLLLEEFEKASSLNSSNCVQQSILVPH